MKIKKTRQMLKSFADDTRLRIIGLLSKQSLNVSEISEVLDVNQSSVSKHLARLRLTGIVADKRRGMNVYYYLIKPENKTHRELINAIIIGLKESEAFQYDLARLKKIKGDRK